MNKLISFYQVMSEVANVTQVQTAKDSFYV